MVIQRMAIGSEITVIVNQKDDSFIEKPHLGIVPHSCLPKFLSVGINDEWLILSRKMYWQGIYSDFFGLAWTNQPKKPRWLNND